MRYRLTFEKDLLTCTIHESVDTTRFIFPTETPEEKAARRALEKTQVPNNNLKNLVQRARFASWRACELYGWMDTHAPGYEFLGLRKTTIGGLPVLDGKSNAIVKFAREDHAVLFKLTWGGR